MGAEQSNQRTCNKSVQKQQSTGTNDPSKSTAERRFLANFPDGYMTKAQFVEFYKLMNMSCMPDEECEHLFHIADVNNDGQVTYDEYQLFCDILSSGSVIDRLRLTFKLYDKDNSKGIAKQEIVRMLKGLYKSKNWNDVDGRAQRNTDIILKQLDGDSDGTLTEEEFLEIASRDDLISLIFGNELETK